MTDGDQISKPPSTPAPRPRPGAKGMAFEDLKNWAGLKDASDGQFRTTIDQLVEQGLMTKFDDGTYEWIGRGTG